MLTLIAGTLVAVGMPALQKPAAAAQACVGEAADEAAAGRLAVQCGSAVEAVSGRTERSQVFVEPSGVRRLRTSVVPQRVRKADGSWAAIATDLSRRSDGTYRPAVSMADVAFSGGGSGPLVTWREDGSTFTLSWPTPLPAPRIEGDTAIYESVLPDVNLHVMATRDGYRHTVEVKSATAAHSAEVRTLRYLTGGDMRITAPGDRTLRMTSRAGRTVAVSRAATMWDSSADPARGGEVLPLLAGERSSSISDGTEPIGEPATAAEPAVTSRVAEADVSVAAGELKVSTDATMMADPNLTYPLFIDPPFEKQRNKWAYSTSNGENNDGSAARVGKQPPDEYSSNGQLYRSYYGFDVNALNGKHVLDAVTRITLDHSSSCTPTWVHLYRTSAITVSSGGRMAWTTRPLPSGVWLDSWEGNANEAGGCGGKAQPDTDAEFTNTALTTDLQQFATKGWDVFTVGLCACNETGGWETAEDRWKKFYTDKAWLEVTYNTVPGMAVNLTAAGKPCGSTIGTTVVKLRAQYVDADGAANTIRGWYGYKEASAATHQSVGDPVVRPANNYGEVTLDFGAGANGKTYTFHVQTKDSLGDSSPITAWCNFTINTTAGAVRVTSTTYPADETARGGPGVPGLFKFEPEPGDAGSVNIVSYSYWWDGLARTTVSVSPGSSYTTQLTPPRYGLNTLNVEGRNAAGVPGARETYQFLVAAPSAMIAHWPLTSMWSRGLTDLVGGHDLTIDSVSNDASWTPDSWVLGEQTLRLDAVAGGQKGWASASGTGLDTSGSFGVAAWVKRSGACTGNQSAVSIDGVNTSGFRLSLDCATGKWLLRIPNLDQTVPLLTDAITSTLPMDQWIHLAGTWDEAEQRARLYVDGQLVSEVKPEATWLSTRGSGWRADGNVIVGRDRAAGVDGNAFTGEVRDLRLWNRVIVADDMNGTDANPAIGTDDRPGLLAAEPVAAWNFNMALDFCDDPESTGPYWSPSPQLQMVGCTYPYSPQQTAGYTAEAHDSDGALWLNSTQPEGYGSAGDGKGHAVTYGPIVPTSQSLTISTWVQLNAVTAAEQVVLRESDGAVKLATSTNGKWQFAVQSPSGTWSTALSDAPAQTGEWVHLIGVFDATAAKTRLYVNGTRQATEGTDAVGRPSSKVLYVGTGYAGNGANMAGKLDQLNIYAGAMPERQAKRLYGDSR
ncbi:LamG domain-containing protein [Micromonospora sp. NPDC005215]|uniref:LamG domain-containing protein n=1 Tax=Micromonospora sp. NPDC005215 TaxID=3157024 RepID=UPI00339FF1B2